MTDRIKAQIGGFGGGKTDALRRRAEVAHSPDIVFDEFPRMAIALEKCPKCMARQGQHCTDWQVSSNQMNMIPFSLERPHDERLEALEKRVTRTSTGLQRARARFATISMDSPRQRR